MGLHTLHAAVLIEEHLPPTHVSLIYTNPSTLMLTNEGDSQEI